MYSYRSYRFEDGDVPSPKDILESFNLVAEFAPELREEDSAGRRAYNRIVKNQEFTAADVNVLADYALKICKRINQKYGASGEFKEAPWAESILLARSRLQGVIIGLQNLTERAGRVAPQ